VVGLRKSTGSAALAASSFQRAFLPCARGREGGLRLAQDRASPIAIGLSDSRIAPRIAWAIGLILSYAHLIARIGLALS
jgi:hypothetical protein